MDVSLSSSEALVDRINWQVEEEISQPRLGQGGSRVRLVLELLV